MVAKASHSVGVINGIMLSLSDVLLLELEESVALVNISGSGNVATSAWTSKYRYYFPVLKKRWQATL